MRISASMFWVTRQRKGALGNGRERLCQTKQISTSMFWSNKGDVGCWLVSWFLTRRFLRRKPRSCWLFCTLRYMWSFHWRLLDSSTPRYLDVHVSISSGCWPFIWKLCLVGNHILVTLNTLHLYDWNDIPYVVTHSANLCRSCWICWESSAVYILW